MKMELKLKIDGNAVMEYFCYSYSRMLIDTAKQLLDENAIFKISPEEYQRTPPKEEGSINTDMLGVLDNFAGTVLTCIVQQIPMDIAVGTTATLNEVKKILDISERFLNIFEETEK